MGIQIGTVAIPNPVFLAPMSGVTDEPFRVLAHAHGAGLVVSEMVASEELVKRGPICCAGPRAGPNIATRDPACRPRGALDGRRGPRRPGSRRRHHRHQYGLSGAAGDRRLSGSALMRDLDHACSLIEATVAGRRPVTLKMRLGWDAHSMNAPELAAPRRSDRRSNDHRSRTHALPVLWRHGRLARHSTVKEAIAIPLIANGDIVTVPMRARRWTLSGADGVMIGRGAYGRPWWPGVIAKPTRSRRRHGRTRRLRRKCELLIAAASRRSSITMVPRRAIGLARKHLGWTIERIVERRLVPSQRAATSAPFADAAMSDKDGLACNCTSSMRSLQDKEAGPRDDDPIALATDRNIAELPSAAAILDALPNAVLVVDDDDRIRFANSGAEDFFQASSATLVRCRLTDLVPAQARCARLLRRSVSQAALSRNMR